MEKNEFKLNALNFITISGFYYHPNVKQIF